MIHACESPTGWQRLDISSWIQALAKMKMFFAHLSRSYLHPQKHSTCSPENLQTQSQVIPAPSCAAAPLPEEFYTQSFGRTCCWAHPVLLSATTREELEQDLSSMWNRITAPTASHQKGTCQPTEFSFPHHKVFNSPRSRALPLLSPEKQEEAADILRALRRKNITASEGTLNDLDTNLPVIRHLFWLIS